MVPPMTKHKWKVGEFCQVAGEGDEVFVVAEVGFSGALLRGHGREPFAKMTRPPRAKLEKLLQAALRRTALLTIATAKARP